MECVLGFASLGSGGLVKLRSIQVLRAVAAIAVVLFHFTKGGFAIGPAGVDLFFVISGFIMATVSPGRTARQFLADRAWRIYPLYFVCLAMFVPLVALDRSQCQDIASLTLWPVWGEYCNSYLIPAWTLSLELFFYGLVALTITRSNLLFAIMLSLVATGVVFSSPLTQFVGHPMMLEFLMGFAIARLPLNSRAGWSMLVLSLVPAVAFYPVDFYSWQRVIVCGVPAAALAYVTLCHEGLFARKAFALPVLLGDASYSIYLVHFSVLALNFSNPLIGIYVAVFGGYFVYLVVEKPLLGWRRKRQRLDPAVA